MDHKEFTEKALKLSLLDFNRLELITSLLDDTIDGSVKGEIWECGVYRGGSALYIASYLANILKDSRKIRLFDTFSGIPKKSESDQHNIGDFSKGVNFQEIEKLFKPFPAVSFRKGFIPRTFKGLEGCQIALAHIDVDMKESVSDCLNFIYPRLSKGGFIILDDFGCSSCKGAFEATMEFIEPLKDDITFRKCGNDTNPQAFLEKLI